MLAELLQRADVWRGRQAAPDTGRPTVATGFAALDAALPGSGWPLGALTEVYCPREGMGELTLLLPALARCSDSRRWIAWVAPPHIPYAPALAAAGIDLARFIWVRPEQANGELWAMEQALRSGACGAVLGWPGPCDNRALRRLQLAAEHGQALAFLYRPSAAARTPSSAALRLTVKRAGDGLEVELLKCRGRWAAEAIRLPEPGCVPAPLRGLGPLPQRITS